MSFTEIGQLVVKHFKQREWWKRDDAKELASCHMVESGELLDCFLNKRNMDWVSIAEEIADCQIYLSAIAEKMCINIPQAVKNKIAKNELRYPPRCDDICRNKGDI